MQITIQKVNQLKSKVLKFNNNLKYKKVLVNLNKLTGQQLYEEIALIAQFTLNCYGADDPLFKIIINSHLYD